MNTQLNYAHVGTNPPNFTMESELDELIRYEQVESVTGGNGLTLHNEISVGYVTSATLEPG